MGYLQTYSCQAGLPCNNDQALGLHLLYFGRYPIGTERVPDMLQGESGPVPEAKGIMKNRLKVCYWLSEWKTLRFKME